MDEKMYYEVKDITDGAQVKAAYDYAVENNIKFYRAVSKSGKYYYWEGETYKKLPNGEEWAKNPLYVIVPTEEQTEEIGALEEAEEAENSVKAESAEEPLENEDFSEAEDYKVLYASTQERYEALETEYMALTHDHAVLQETYEALEKESLETEMEYGEIIEALTTIVNLIKSVLNKSVAKDKSDSGDKS